MAGNPQVVVDFVADTAQLNKGFSQASSGAGGFTSKLKGLAKGGALAAGAAGIAGLTAAVKIGIDEFTEASKVTAQTNAVIKSTGKVANVSAGHVSALAESLMKKSGVDDEAIQSGENLLLTFTNVRNEVGKGNDIFDQATTAALDMSVALGTDMKDASMNLGKALNDPTEGLGKLKRSGVTFTDSQADMIKSLQASGDMLGAQKIILEEVNKEFGGSAEAAGKTLPGQINILKQSFSNLMGDLVAKVIPVLQDTISWLRDHWPEISAALATAWATIGPLLAAIGGAAEGVATLIKNNWGTIGPILEAVVTNVQNQVKIIVSVLKLITALLKGDWAEAWEQAKNVVTNVFNYLVGYVTGVVTTIKSVITLAWNVIKTATTTAWNAIESAVSSAVSGAKTALTGLASWIVTFATGVFDRAVDKVAAVFTAVSGAATTAVSGVKTALNGLITWLGDIVDNVKTAAGKVANAITGPINSVIKAWNGLEFPRIEIKIPSKKILGKKIGGGSFGFGPVAFPDIPQLAKGGIITSPTLALIGEAGPEAVVPLDRMAPPNLEVRVYIGDTELRGMVRAEVVDTNTGIARTLLAGGVA